MQDEESKRSASSHNRNGRRNSANEEEDGPMDEAKLMDSLDS